VAQVLDSWLVTDRYLAKISTGQVKINLSCSVRARFVRIVLIFCWNCLSVGGIDGVDRAGNLRGLDSWAVDSWKRWTSWRKLYTLLVSFALLGFFENDFASTY